MKKWQKNEVECFEFLNSTINYKQIIFSKNGDSDSTTNDIEVLYKDELLFSIEVKSLISQSGQFVLDIEKDKFHYSNNNKKNIDVYSKSILDELNSNFDNYKNVNSKGIEIEFRKEVFYAWIKNYYLKKNVCFIVTKYNDNFILFKTDRISEYYNVKAFLRRKKSGSRSLESEIYASEVANLLRENNYKIKSYSKKDKIYIFYIEESSDKIKINGLNNRFLLNKVSSEAFVARILSKTNNINVIFSIFFKNKKPAIQNDDLIAFIKSTYNI
jgi:hypothetical protein